MSVTVTPETQVRVLAWYESSRATFDFEAVPALWKELEKALQPIMEQVDAAPACTPVPVEGFAPNEWECDLGEYEKDQRDIQMDVVNESVRRALEILEDLRHWHVALGRLNCHQTWYCAMHRDGERAARGGLRARGRSVLGSLHVRVSHAGARGSLHVRRGRGRAAVEGAHAAVRAVEAREGGDLIIACNERDPRSSLPCATSTRPGNTARRAKRDASSR